MLDQFDPKGLYDAISFAANTTSIYVNLKNLKINIPGHSIQSALNDHTEIEIILDSLFFRKQVMWERADYEDKNWCISSLIDLREKCDKQSESFRLKSSQSDKNYFLATLLRTWGSFCDGAYKDLVKTDLTGDKLEKILAIFRKKSYPIIVTLIYSLPSNNLVRINSLKRLEDGVKNSKIKPNQIIPTWSIGN